MADPLQPRLPHTSTETGFARAGDDDELEAVADHLLRLDPDGSRVATVIRATFDQLLDGARTGRFDYNDLRKTEKTHMGTLVEINLHREFDFDDGRAMDYRIAGSDVDCKFSRSQRGWQIPLEAVGHLCLLLWADDQRGLASGGLIRIRDDILGRGENRDRKRTLNEGGMQEVLWLWRDRPLPENLLLHLDAATRDEILSPPGRRHGQERTDKLFRLVQGRLVSRTTVLTVAQQDDAPKRVRDARLRLRAEGIVILGHQGDHPRIARLLGIPTAAKGQWVSARVTLRGSSHSAPQVSIQGNEYRLALADDPVGPAPVLDARKAE